MKRKIKIFEILLMLLIFGVSLKLIGSTANMMDTKPIFKYIYTIFMFPIVLLEGGVIFYIALDYICEKSRAVKNNDEKTDVDSINCKYHNMKIYVPKNNEIRERIATEIYGHEEFDYTCNSNEYEFWKEISEEEYTLLDIHSEEHRVGNILVYENNKAFILDGFGYFHVTFEPTN